MRARLLTAMKGKERILTIVKIAPRYANKSHQYRNQSRSLQLRGTKDNACRGQGTYGFLSVSSQSTSDALPHPRHHLRLKIEAYRLPLDDSIPLDDSSTQLTSTKADSGPAGDATNTKQHPTPQSRLNAQS